MVDTLISPFRNESECLRLGGLTIENRLDRISIFGSLDITKDKEGLAAAKTLKAILDLTLDELESAELPDKITLDEADIVKNPFT
jgi:hypothetical protein